MAQLNFDMMINMTSHSHNSQPKYVDRLIIGNEPNNSIFQYYIKDRHLKDKKGAIVYSNYSTLDWELPTSSITTQQVRSFGVKTFPGIGAIGFYEPLVGTGRILLPIHIKSQDKYNAPILIITDKVTTVSFKITQPDDITYTCFRIIFESAHNAFEYITYDLDGTLPKPSVNGTYKVYCIGYVDEGSYVSYDSNSFELKVTSGTDHLMPAVPKYASTADLEELRSYFEELINK